MFLLDTNVCLDFAKARSDRLRSRVRAQDGRGMAISAITFAELRFGASRPGADEEDERRLGVFVSILPIAPFDETVGTIYGQLGRYLSVRRNSFDLLITAHAISLGAVLVTSNERDFSDIAGLRVENWTK